MPIEEVLCQLACLKPLRLFALCWRASSQLSCRAAIAPPWQKSFRRQKRPVLLGGHAPVREPLLPASTAVVGFRTVLTGLLPVPVRQWGKHEVS